ncbi:hypothetical protein IPJ72_03410 [Candidatus Peregrinibacteria bacterium]|nr:MAG: hypothetical protein IPJ72_03410 [Candidatus Peregrinibacteria bacterium]
MTRHETFSIHVDSALATLGIKIRAAVITNLTVSRDLSDDLTAHLNGQVAIINGNLEERRRAPVLEAYRALYSQFSEEAIPAAEGLLNLIESGGTLPRLITWWRVITLFLQKQV